MTQQRSKVLWVKLARRDEISFCNYATLVIVAHDARGIRTINIEKVILRDLFLIRHLQSDERVISYEAID